MMKRIIIGLLAITLSLSATACGSNTSSSGEGAAETTKSADGLTDKDKEDIQKARDELSDKDKKELDEIAKELEGGTPSDNKAEEPAVEEVKYAPKQEILDADFDSGLVQIGDDIFKCGGYLTLGDFVQQYGDNWEWNNITNGQYADINALLADSVDTTPYERQYEFKFANKNDPTLVINAYCIPFAMNIKGEIFNSNVYNKINDKISDLIVFDIYADRDSVMYEYYPKGVKRYRPIEPDASNQVTDETVKEFFNNNFGIATMNDKTNDTTVTKIANYLVNYEYVGSEYNFDDSNCFNFCNKDSITVFDIDNSNASNIKEYVVIRELKENNLLGYKPSIACAVITDKEYHPDNSAFAYYSMQLTKDDNYQFYTISCNGNLVVVRNVANLLK